MAVSHQSSVPAISSRPTQSVESLNAQRVTAIAINFLKSLGHKGKLNPTRVFLEDGHYMVEAEIGKKVLAKIRIDRASSQIREYHIEKKPEESSANLPVEPKAIMIMVGTSLIVSLIFSVLDLQSILGGLF
ncbi:MAG: hypothetical protein NWE81_01770 [Candidatus Bathyarchaeota archaeon]|nr:hypothetical protein [Candidatus Bathyarchaeota archaeon]